MKNTARCSSPARRGVPSLELHLGRSVFATGRRLSGVVVFRLSKPAGIRSLSVAVTGYETPAGAALSRGLRRPGAFFQREILLSGMNRPRFVSERISQYWNAFLARDVGRILSPGEHTYPFSMTLPASLPPSYLGKAGKIDYRVTARVCFPLAPAIQVFTEVPVVLMPRGHRGRPVALSYPTAGGTVHSTETGIQLELPNRNAELGNRVLGHFAVTNPQGIEIPRVSVSLETCEWVRLASTEKLDRDQIDLRTIEPSDRRAPAIESDFELSIPASAPPTTEGTAISVIWLLKVTVDTNPPLELKTPITVYAPLPEV